MSFSSAFCFSNVQLVNASVNSPTQTMRGSAHALQEPAVARTPAQNPRSARVRQRRLQLFVETGLEGRQVLRLQLGDDVPRERRRRRRRERRDLTASGRRLHGRLCRDGPGRTTSAKAKI